MSIEGSKTVNAERIKELTAGWEKQTDGLYNEGPSNENFFSRVRRKYQFPRAPVVPHIDAAILAAVTEGGGSLDMGRWHSCGTTHCRAGWAVILAGPKGWALEKRWGAEEAGALIYRASRPGVPDPDFFATADETINDLRTWAKLNPLPTDGETA